MNILDYRTLAYKKHVEITGQPVDNVFKLSYNIILNKIMLEIYEQSDNIEDFERRLLMVVENNSIYSLVDAVEQYTETVEFSIIYECTYKNIYERILVDTFKQIIRRYKINKGK